MPESLSFPQARMRRSAFLRLLTGSALLTVGAVELHGVPPAGAQIEPSKKPSKIVIAHRGASGYLPEHTLEAYAMAHTQGADYIEPDVVLTRDGVLVCLHDLYLETTTDAATRFPGRQRENGHWYAIDFTLDEIRSLRVFGRVSAAEREKLPRFTVPTLEELIQLVQYLNGTTGRSCGLLVETKLPTSFHEKEGKPLERPLLELLGRYGYRGPDSKAIIQTFEAPSQKKLRHELKTDLPLVFLTSAPITDAVLKDTASYANGIAPNRRALEGTSAAPLDAKGTVRKAHQAGLKVFVWTFNAEEPEMRRFLWDYGIDGVITNHPDVGRKAAVGK